MSKQLSFMATTPTPKPVETPRSRLREVGPTYLSHAELLSLVLDVPVPQASQILDAFGDFLGLARASLAELMAYPGISEARASRIKATLEIGRQVILANPPDRMVVRSPADVANLVRSKLDENLDQEQLWVVLLNARNAVLGCKMIYQGSVNTMQVRPAEIFREAIRESAVALVILHTHPSGDPQPSPEDVEVTKQIVQSGRTLGIEVLDHLILGRQPMFVSLKERGLGFR